MNASEPTLLIHRVSSDRAPRWRAATSLALSLALHALLLVLFPRPAPPAASPGRLDVVTVYLRDSREASPPPAPEARSVSAPSQRVVAPRGVAQTPVPPGRNPTASVRA